MSSDILTKIDNYFQTFPDDESSQNLILKNLINEKETFIKNKKKKI